MVKFTFLAEEDCLSSGISGIIDALSIANILWQFHGKQDKPLFSTEIVTLEGKPVKANGGMTLNPDRAMENVEDSDVIIIPAFFKPFDTGGIRMDAICCWLQQHHLKGTRLAAMCTGSFLLARAGLLDGKVATTNWQFAGYFKKIYPEVDLRIDRIYTEDSGIYCTGAATAFMDLCLHFVEKFGSVNLARRCAKSLLVDHERQDQTPYIVHDFWKKHSDSQVLLSQEMMEEKYADKLSMDEIARQMGISPRHFKRRFKKATGENPLSYLQLVRIENAKRELETTTRTINEITWASGYEDINSFRKLFKKHTGVSPREYRKRFSWTPSPTQESCAIKSN
ncbi:MAG: helix-turn-helix domain-containing protein [Desulfobacteraceae bacterium]|nr:helix-turn-helix domain-containing protein [Desulfobacteraceae bacterium]